MLLLTAKPNLKNGSYRIRLYCQPFILIVKIVVCVAANKRCNKLELLYCENLDNLISVVYNINAKGINR